jgi:polar amino acid transport system substrate-binding protein
MKIKSTLLALLTGAALVAGACTSSTASPSASAAAGTVCEKAIAAKEPATSLLGSICAAKSIKIATDPAYPPYSSLDASGEYVGFDSDTAREVAKRLGVTIEWVTPDWSAITAGSWAGRWDISIGSMTQTAERAAVVDFVEPYFYEAGYVIVPTDSAAASLADLAGKVGCAGESTTHSQWIEGKLTTNSFMDVYNAPPTRAVLKTYKTDHMCIEAYLAGRTTDWDFMAQSKEFLTAAVAESAGKLKFLNDTANFSSKVSFALDKSGKPDATLLAELNTIVMAMHDDGTLTALSIKNLDGVDKSKP